MELLDLNYLNTIKFKGLHNREIDYAELFFNRRILVLYLPSLIVMHEKSWHHLRNYQNRRSDFLNIGIDDIYSVSSSPWIIPFIRVPAENILALHDHNMQFLTMIKNHTQSNRNITELAKNWQFVAVINCGQIEKIIFCPTKENAPLRISMAQHNILYKLDPDLVLTKII